MITEAADQFRRAAQEGGVDLSTVIPDNLPPVNGDATQIATVFSNLLSNALRYTEPGGRIIISAKAEEQSVNFSVTDTGAGIPRQYLERIFEQFFRVPHQQGETGTGLGLFIVKEIVEAHGGTIAVESHEGAGTTFSFTLKTGEQPSAGV
jgi:signal transduction histidine kinase